MKLSRFAELSIEEVANTATHGLGLLLSICGFIFLTLIAWRGDRWQWISSLVYGISLVVLYAASTLYHSTTSPHHKRLFQLLDHCCIFLLIAGSYTPFLLVLLRDGIGIGMLWIVWAIAISGILLKVIFRERANALGIVMYLALGWLGVFAVKPIYYAAGLIPMILIIAGGVSYSAGMIFFGWKSIRHHHAIFHVFVLIGSIIHYAAITFYIMPEWS